MSEIEALKNYSLSDKSGKREETYPKDITSTAEQCKLFRVRVFVRVLYMLCASQRAYLFVFGVLHTVFSNRAVHCCMAASVGTKSVRLSRPSSTCETFVCKSDRLNSRAEITASRSLRLKAPPLTFSVYSNHMHMDCYIC